jgi:hypothetical protein
LKAHEVTPDGGCRWGRRVVLEAEQAGAGVACGNLDQEIDRRPQPGRQARGNHVEQRSGRARDLGGDDPFEGSRRRQDNPPTPQARVDPGQQISRALSFENPLAQPIPETGFGISLKARESEIAADAQRLLPLRLGAAGAVEEQHRRQLELAGQMVDDPQRGLPVVVQKPTAGPQHAELQGVPAPVIVAAALADLGEVGRRQAPVAGEFVLVRLGRRRNPPPHAGCLRDGVIRRH